MEITRCVSADEAKKELATRVSSELASFWEDGIPVLLFFSGGSALSILDLLSPEVFGPSLTLSPVDERFDPSGAASNFTAFMGTDAYRNALSAGASFIDTRVKAGQGRDALADAFENEIRNWKSTHAAGKMVAILGMGPDGHTAGIFPDEDEQSFQNRFETNRSVVGYRGPEYATCPERVTVTLSFLRKEVARGFVFFSGEEKREAWSRVRTGTEGLNRIPAGIFRELPYLEAYTDLS